MTDSYKILNSLTPDNGKFFFDLMRYLRTKGFLKNALSLELKINEIANDLKHADLEEVSAQDFFGNQPKEMAHEILKSLPNDKISHLFKTHLLLLIAFLCVISFASSAYTDEINGITHHYISLLTLLVMTSYFIIYIFIITSALVSHGVFTQKMRKATPYLTWIVMMIGLIMPRILHIYHLDIWRYEIQNYLSSAALKIGMVAIVLYAIQQFPLVDLFKTRNRF